MHHYLRMASGNFREHLQGETVWPKQDLSRAGGCTLLPKQGWRHPCPGLDTGGAPEWFGYLE
jgi:hypothetical protein